MFDYQFQLVLMLLFNILYGRIVLAIQLYVVKIHNLHYEPHFNIIPIILYLKFNFIFISVLEQILTNLNTSVIQLESLSSKILSAMLSTSTSKS